eukprot:1013560-Prymnesium_polylepis.1
MRLRSAVEEVVGDVLHHAHRLGRRRPPALQRRRGSSQWVRSLDERRLEKRMEMTSMRFSPRTARGCNPR